MTKTVEIWTDGACSGNPGPGGWGVLLKYGDARKELYGGEEETTNNRMELTAAIKALETLSRTSDVILHTDSTYVKDGLTKWIHGWKRNGWKTAAKKPVKNEDLWRQLDEAAKVHRVDWRWVKGHDGDPGNERADALAVLGAGLAAGTIAPAPRPGEVSRIYKIVPAATWNKARSGLHVPYSVTDRKDGFLHLSTWEETEKSARLYYDKADDILALEIETETLGGDALRWEWSGSRKAWFPHVYGDLSTKTVAREIPFERNAKKKWCLKG